MYSELGTVIFGPHTYFQVRPPPIHRIYRKIYWFVKILKVCQYYCFILGVCILTPLVPASFIISLVYCHYIIGSIDYFSMCFMTRSIISLFSYDDSMIASCFFSRSRQAIGLTQWVYDSCYESIHYFTYLLSLHGEHSIYFSVCVLSWGLIIGSGKLMKPVGLLQLL